MIIQIDGDTEKVRESRICIVGNPCDYLALCSFAVAYIDNSKSNVIMFIRNLLRVFSPPIIIFLLKYLVVQYKKTYIRQSCAVCT